MLKFSIQKSFNDNKTMCFNGEIKSSGVCAIFGDSGAGKTTLLRCLIGLESCTGNISFNQQIWLSTKQLLAAEQRRIGVVFQEPRLFPHLNVMQNLQLAVAKAKSDRFSIEILAEQLGFSELLTHQTTQLSGGQKQRIAIARALLTDPQLLVMDEPLSSLDIGSRQLLLPFLKKISLQIPIIYITHSMHELFYLSQQMLLVNQGQIEAIGEPQQLFLDSELSLIKFAHQGLIVNVTVQQYNRQEALLEGRLDGQPLFITAQQAPTSKQIQVKISSRDVIIANKPITDSSLLNCIAVEVIDFLEDSGQAVVLTLKIQQQFIYARITCRSFKNLNIEVGSRVYAHVKTMSIINQ